MHRIFGFTKKYFLALGNLLGIYIILSLSLGVIELAIPYILGSFVDQLSVAKAFSFGSNYMILITLVSFSMMIVGYFVDRLYYKLLVKPAHDLNTEAIGHVQRTSVLGSLHKDVSYLSQRINNDANHLIMFCINVFQQILTYSLKFLVPLVLFFSFNMYLGFLLLGLNGLYAITYAMLKRPLFRANFRRSENASHMFSEYTDQLSRVRFLQTHGIVSESTLDLETHFTSLYESALSEQRISYVYSSMDRVLLLCANLSLFYFGGQSVIDKSMSIGQFTMVLSYFNIMMGATKYFFIIAGDVPQVLVFYRRLKEIFMQQQLANGKETISSIEMISLKKLSFSYPGERSVFQQLNYTFEKGKIYALKGSNGSGKSTLIQLILGLFVEEQEGSVCYNGIDIKDIDMMQLRRDKIAVCEQEPFLMRRSVRYNLTFGAKTGQNAIEPYLQMLNLTEVINNLSDGFSTIIEEGTGNLSGGEKQRIALARTFLKDADLLILDEPTSALDTDSKKRLLEFLPTVKVDKIVVISTHDKDVLELADHVLVFQDADSFELSS